MYFENNILIWYVNYVLKIDIFVLNFFFCCDGFYSLKTCIFLCTYLLLYFDSCDMFCGCFGKCEKLSIEIQVKKKHTNIGATSKYHTPKHPESTK